MAGLAACALERQVLSGILTGELFTITGHYTSNANARVCSGVRFVFGGGRGALRVKGG